MREIAGSDIFADGPGEPARLPCPHLSGSHRDARERAERVSKNAFASSTSQNCGNFISERSSVRLHAVCATGSSPCAPVSATQDNCGRPSADLAGVMSHQPAGGHSSICFGVDEKENCHDEKRSQKAHVPPPATHEPTSCRKVWGSRPLVCCFLPCAHNHLPALTRATALLRLLENGREYCALKSGLRGRSCEGSGGVAGGPEGKASRSFA
eukprot:scaffold6740_cov350-Prasinococcus_capsulatus_cf.AAC.2